MNEMKDIDMITIDIFIKNLKRLIVEMYDMNNIDSKNVNILIKKLNKMFDIKHIDVVIRKMNKIQRLIRKNEQER